MSETEWIRLRLPADTLVWLRGRARRSGTSALDVQLRLELETWRQVQPDELLRVHLTLAGINMITAVCRDFLLTPPIAGRSGLLDHLYEALGQARLDPPAGGTFGDQWGVDEESLLAYLHTLSPTALHAVEDAISRLVDSGLPQTREGWARVGLTLRAESP